MFTGIVQAVATIEKIFERDGIRFIELSFLEGFTEGITRGASVSVDGVCLTVTSFGPDDTATFDIVSQSLAVTTLQDRKVGDRVNVERAASEGAEIGGHILSGHVDFAAKVAACDSFDGNKRLRFAIPDGFARYIFAKGYVAVDGCSLTVAECDKKEGWFDIWLIPETRRATTLDAKGVGDHVNVELERRTQVIVDTIRDTLEEQLGKLLPVFERYLDQSGVNFTDISASRILENSSHSPRLGGPTADSDKS